MWAAQMGRLPATPREKVAGGGAFVHQESSPSTPHRVEYNAPSSGKENNRAPLPPATFRRPSLLRTPLRVHDARPHGAARPPPPPLLRACPASPAPPRRLGTQASRTPPRTELEACMSPLTTLREERGAGWAAALEARVDDRAVPFKLGLVATPRGSPQKKDESSPRMRTAELSLSPYDAATTDSPLASARFAFAPGPTNSTTVMPADG